MTDKQTRRDSQTPSLTVMQLTAVLSVLSVFYQFISAGQILSENMMAVELHGGGAIGLHVITGLTAVSAAVHWRLTRTATWPTVVMVVMFALSFVQAKLGETGALWAHIPCALLLTVGVVWFAAWSFRPAARN